MNDRQKDIVALKKFDSGCRDDELIVALYKVGWIEPHEGGWRISELGLYWLPAVVRS